MSRLSRWMLPILRERRNYSDEMAALISEETVEGEELAATGE